MSDHLPECEMASPTCAGNGDGGHRGFMFCLHCHRRCICAALRACEQRVLDAAWGAVESVDDARGQGDYVQGWMDGWDECVAAIDPLRGER